MSSRWTQPTPEQEARIRAVGPGSPLLERAGALLFGVYIPQTFDELIALNREIDRLTSDERSALVTALLVSRD